MIPYPKHCCATLVALAGSLAVSAASLAATVTAPSVGDLFLGFRATGGQGNATSYLINLGPDTFFRNATPGSTASLALGNLGADLTATYGANWNTRADVQWSVFGTRGTGFVANYSTREQNPVGLPSVSYNPQDQTQRSNVSGAINDVLVQPGGYLGRDATANSAAATLQPNSNTANSYAFQVGGGSNAFGSLSGWADIEGDFGGGTAGTALDLFRYSGTATSNTATRLGTFSISDSGAVSFAAVPEPGAAGLSLAAAALALTGRRRRTVHV